MNFIFISPHFPGNYYRFCAELKNNGVNVLGIGDASYDSLPYHLRSVLTEYYRVDSMESYDQMMRAVAYFTHKYGKVDWIESNNEYWLRQDARLRTDFNITSGYFEKEIYHLQSKLEMKQYYRAAGIPAAECCLAADEETCRDFAKKHGYPLVAKPNRGLGAQMICKLCDEGELLEFLREKKGETEFVLEPYINGTICSYEAIVNSRSEAVFESGNVAMVPIMDCVNECRDAFFYTEKNLPEDVREAGRLCLKAFGVRSRFVHLEFFRLKEDFPGLGKAGDIVGLEANLRPAGGFTPDMLNYANSCDVYKIWADMIAFDRSTLIDQYEHYYCVYVGRRDCNNHRHSHTEVLSRYRAQIMMSDRMPAVLAKTMGDLMYIAKFSEKSEMKEFLEYVLN